MRHSLPVTIGIMLFFLAAPVFAGTAATDYFQGWEDAGWVQGIPDWDDGVVRVASGTNGITSATGSGHAEAAGANGPYTPNGGYSADWGGGWVERLDVYLDLSNASDSNYWWSLTTAINKNVSGAASHLQDNIFFCAGGDASGDFIVGVRNTNEGVKNAAWLKTFAAGQVLTLTQSQWVTFEWAYYEDGTTQKSDYNVYNANGDLLLTFTGPSHDLNNCDGLGNPIGGNRYTWFINIKDTVGAGQGDSWLAIDNSSTTYASAPVPEPISLVFFGSGLAGVMGFVARRRAKKAA